MVNEALAALGWLLLAVLFVGAVYEVVQWIPL